MRDSIEVLTPTSARATDGSIETVETSIGTFYGSIRTDNMAEMSSQGNMVAYTKYSIKMRYNTTDLTSLGTNSKLVVDGKTLDIVSASVEDNRDRIIEVIAEERL